MEIINTVEVAKILGIPWEEKKIKSSIMKIQYLIKSGKITPVGKGVTKDHGKNILLFDKKEIDDYKDFYIANQKRLSEKLTIKYVAKKLNLSVSMIRKFMREGKVKYTYEEGKYRFEKEDIQELERSRDGVKRKLFKRELRELANIGYIPLKDWLNRYPHVSKDLIYDWKLKKKFTYFYHKNSQTDFVKPETIEEYYESRYKEGKIGLPLNFPQ